MASKWREFSIFDNFYFREKHNSYQCVELPDGRPLENSDVHVIERQALDEVLELIGELNEEITQLKQTQEILERALGETKASLVSEYRYSEFEKAIAVLKDKK